MRCGSTSPRRCGATGPLGWTDELAGEQAARPERQGDVVLARKETPTSYHLAVTVDDEIQGVTVVTRGRDLFEATHVHRLLQALLGYSRPGMAPSRAADRFGGQAPGQAQRRCVDPRLSGGGQVCGGGAGAGGISGLASASDPPIPEPR